MSEDQFRSHLENWYRSRKNTCVSTGSAEPCIKGTWNWGPSSSQYIRSSEHLRPHLVHSASPPRNQWLIDFLIEALISGSQDSSLSRVPWAQSMSASRMANSKWLRKKVQYHRSAGEESIRTNWYDVIQPRYYHRNHVTTTSKLWCRDKKF